LGLKAGAHSAISHIQFIGLERILLSLDKREESAEVDNHPHQTHHG